MKRYGAKLTPFLLLETPFQPKIHVRRNMQTLGRARIIVFSRLCVNLVFHISQLTALVPLPAARRSRRATCAARQSGDAPERKPTQHPKKKA
jgi:hypothetical protein